MKVKVKISGAAEKTILGLGVVVVVVEEMEVAEGFSPGYGASSLVNEEVRYGYVLG
jgi:hypothetical protein